MSNRAEQIARRKSQIPISYRQIYRKATKGNSLRAAINAKCLDCSNWQRNEIKDCLVADCPLWAVRPYQPPHRDPDLAGNSPVEAEIILERKQLVLSYAGENSGA